MAKLTFLGTGTSTGVPVMRCNCQVCRSPWPEDRRLRTSVLLNMSPGHNLLIDCGPDFREQMLRLGSPDLDALLVTHSHYDHVGGLDDLRPYTAGGRDFPVYCQSDVSRDIKERNPWSFVEHRYPGTPGFEMHEIEAGKPLCVSGVEILPIKVIHGKMPILGFRIGKLGYITDCSYLPPESVNTLKGVDVLVINALRHKPHPSHFSLEEALAAVKIISPRRAYLTHMSHDIGLHRQLELPTGVELAFDGLEVEL